MTASSSLELETVPAFLKKKRKTQAEMSTLLEHPVVKLHRCICEIESITGNETPVSKFLVSYLEQRGFTVERQIVPSVYPEERFNILAYSGPKRDARICFSSHIDVVSVKDRF